MILSCYFYDKVQYCTQNKLISKFAVDSNIAFVSYTQFTVSFCCIGQYVGIYVVNMHKSTIWQLFRQPNELAENILQTNIMYLKAFTGVKISIF